MADEPESTEAPEGAAAPEGEGAEGGGVAVAVRDEVQPAPPAGPVTNPRLEQRKMRFWLPLLIPVGSILVVAFFALNISRVFIASAEENHDLATFIGIGLTLAILIGATVIAALPNLRTSSLVIGMLGVGAVVLLAGSLVLGTSLPEAEGEAGYQEPAGEAINTLEVDALPELRFQASSFDVPGGINLIRYIDKGGTHTLVFDKNAVPGFKLAVPEGRSAAKVDLTPDTSYVIYCDIPGHREAGMEADLNVGAAGGTAEPGTETDTPTTTVPGTPTTTQPPGDPASQSSTGS